MYKNKYNEALKKAKEYHKRLLAESYNDYYAEELEHIFPELKESEDEKIMKALKEGFKYHQLFNPTFGGIPCIEIVNWIEKQGEQKVPVVDFKAEDWYVSKVDGKIRNIYHSVDMVEPKFKVGEWITNGRFNKLIVGINSDWPFYMFQDGTSKRIKDIDKKYHLWSIEDAKDGDVLSYETEDELRIFIYNNGHIHYHCCYYNGHLTAVDSFFVIQKHLLRYIHPATKVQRALLFSKMKEAGYTFDFEKKELKKIELAKSESKEELSDFEAALFSAFSDGWQQYLNGEEVDFAQWAKEHSTELLEAANQNHVAWSEEDEDIIQALNACIDEAIKSGLNYISFDSKSILIGKVKSWLKSLKPQNTWKPSEEQMADLYTMVCECRSADHQLLQDLYYGLKTLRGE